MLAIQLDRISSRSSATDKAQAGCAVDHGLDSAEDQAVIVNCHDSDGARRQTVTRVGRQ
jgi:hypothetical protein